MTHPRSVPLGLLVLLCTIADAAAQEPVRTVAEWTLEKAGPTFRSREDVLYVSGGKGWIRTRQEFVDFVLRLEYRLAREGSEAAILVRAWVYRRGDWPASGYRVSIREELTGNDRLGAVTSYRDKVRPVAHAATPAASPSPSRGEWQQLEIRCEGDRLTISVNGTVINVVEGSEPLAGYIGIEGSRGEIEFRNIRLAPAALACQDDRKEDTSRVGVVLPRVRREVRPRYTVEAMTRKVEGTVLLDAVVEADGSVGPVCVRRGLDLDLDAEAVAAAKRWVFEPGTRDNQPVPVRVAIEMTFTLKK